MESNLLFGDIGATKCLVGGGTGEPGRNVHFGPEWEAKSATFDGLPSVALEFLRQQGISPSKISTAVFAVAGPVRNGFASLTQLPKWSEMSAVALSKALGGARVSLINDMEGHIYGTQMLLPEDCLVLQDGEPPEEGTIAYITFGTGVGDVCWRPGEPPFSREGGHITAGGAIGPVTFGLLEYLLEKYGKPGSRFVSAEWLLRMGALVDYYAYLRERHEESKVFVEHPKQVVELAKAGDSCATEVLDLYCVLAGYQVANLVVTSLCYKGVYVGGWAPGIINSTAKRRQLFMQSFLDRGPHSDTIMAKVPVTLVFNQKTALLGAAYRACVLAEGKSE